MLSGDRSHRHRHLVQVAPPCRWTGLLSAENVTTSCAGAGRAIERAHQVASLVITWTQGSRSGPQGRRHCHAGRAARGRRPSERTSVAGTCARGSCGASHPRGEPAQYVDPADQKCPRNNRSHLPFPRKRSPAAPISGCRGSARQSRCCKSGGSGVAVQGGALAWLRRLGRWIRWPGPAFG